MRKAAKRWLRNSCGVALVLLGIVGLFLPILQGVLFLVLGIGMIDHPLKHRLHVWAAGRSRLYRRVSLAYFRMRRRIANRKAARRAPGLSEDVVHDVAEHVGQTEVATRVPEGQSSVVEAERVQDRRV